MGSPEYRPNLVFECACCVGPTRMSSVITECIFWGCGGVGEHECVGLAECGGYDGWLWGVAMGLGGDCGWCGFGLVGLGVVCES